MSKCTTTSWLYVGMVLLTLASLRSTQAKPTTLTRIQSAQRAVAGNLQLIADAIGPARAKATLNAARTGFVPVWQIAPAYRVDTPFDTHDSHLDYATTVRWANPTGTVFGATVNGANALTANALDSAAMSISINQPLLRGTRDSQAVSLDLAEIGFKVEKLRFHDATEALLLEVERAYWALAFAQAEAQIKARSEQQARAQFDTTQENIRRGLLAAGEIHVVNENLVIFQQQRSLAQENLTIAQRNLAQLLNLPLDTPIVASDTLSDDAPVMPGPIDINRNVGLRIAQLQVEQAERQLAFEDNQTDPRLDVDTRVGLTGQPTTPWGEIGQAQRPEGRIGLTLEIPLDWSPLRSQIQAAKLEKRRTQLALNAVRQRVDAQLGNLSTRMRGQTRRYAMNRQRVALAQAKLENEREKYKNGVSTLDDLVRFQQNLDFARISLRRAAVDLKVRRAEILRLEGQLHRDVGVVIR